MHRSVLCVGAAGAGKSRMISTLCAGDVARTDDGSIIDVGVVHAEDAHLVLYGVRNPAQLDGAQRIVAPAIAGLIVLVDHSKLDPVEDLAACLAQLRNHRIAAARLPLVIGATHADQAGRRPLDAYRHYMREHAPDFGGETLPIFRADVRQRPQAGNLLLALKPMMDFVSRFPRHRGHGASLA